MSKKHHLTRRDFLKQVGVTVRRAILACGKSGGLTAVPGSNITALDLATAIPGAGMTALPLSGSADALLVNGRI